MLLIDRRSCSLVCDTPGTARPKEQLRERGMRHLPRGGYDVNLNETYLRRVSRAHLDNSIAALSELADRVTTVGDTVPADTLRIRLGHIDHGGFLSHLLHGFAMTQLSPDGLIAGPDGTNEVLYAVVLNQPLDVQLRTALASVASYLARQDVIGSVRAGDEDATNLDRVVAEMDARVAISLDDTLRLKDWRAAASELRERAAAADFALHVQFAAPLLSADEVRRRVPVMRHVYNRLPIARDTIDKVAAALSAGLTVAGDGVPEAALTAAREILDVGEVRRYTAHLARDAFVCGNGFLEILPAPRSLRLLRSETVEVRAENQFSVVDSPTETIAPIEGHVLHLKGIHQTDGFVGMSVLEPLVVLLAQLEVAESALADGVRLAERVGTTEVEGWAERTRAFAARIKSVNGARMTDLLAGGTAGLAAPPTNLYFPGHVEMEPAAPRLRFMDDAAAS